MWDCSSTLSSAGAGVCAGTGTSAISVISSLSSDLESKEAEASVSNVVGWTRSCDTFSAELCLTVSCLIENSWSLKLGFL